MLQSLFFVCNLWNKLEMAVEAVKPRIGLFRLVGYTWGFGNELIVDGAGEAFRAGLYRQLNFC